MGICSGVSPTRIAVLVLLLVPAFLFWVWLMTNVTWSIQKCPKDCRCSRGETVMECINASLQDIPSGLHSDLKHLTLRGNRIPVLRRNHFIDANLFELNLLDLERNGIIRIEPGAFRGLPKLTDLHLQGNDLSQLENGIFSDVSTLTGLHIAGNKIKKLSPRIFQGMSNLGYISLEENEIEELQEDVFIGLSELSGLHLNNNKIKFVQPNVFQRIPKLTFVDFTGNHHIYVPVKTPFLNVSTLTTLILSECNLTKISTSTFALTPKLSSLKLANNNITAIDLEVMKSLPLLTTLHIFGNPLICDCKLREIWQWCKEYDITVIRTNKFPQCSSPEEVKDLYWDVLSKSECIDNKTQFLGDYKSIKAEYIPWRPEIEEYFNFVKYTESIVFGILFLIGAVGNITVLLIIGCNRRMRIVSNAYIFNLAVGDLLCLLMNLPIGHAMKLSEQWILGDFGCKLGYFLQELSIGVSAFSVALLSVQRYYATSGSIRLSTKRETVVAILLIWLVASCCALPSAFLINLENNKFCTIFFHFDLLRQTVVFNFLVFCLIPLCVITWMYIQTAKMLVSEVPVTPKSAKTLAKIVVGLAIVFLISFMPYRLLIIFIMWVDMEYSKLLGYCIFISICLLALNPCLNPVSLCLSSTTFRKMFHHYLMCCRKTPSSEDEEDYTDLLAGNEIAVRFRNDPTTEVSLH